MEDRHVPTTDIFSNIAKDVIDSILEHLPIQDAVRTSALARSWRYKWTTISELTFGHKFTHYLEEMSLSEFDFISIITNVLLLHRGEAVHTFYLEIPDHYVRVSSGSIHNWILCLSRKGVKEFTLSYPECDPSEFYKFPSHLYACLSLTRLDFSFCVFTPPSGFRGFPKLISLALCEVTLEKMSFEGLISSCPLPEHLSVHVCFGADHINIYSPSLVDLYVGSESRCGLESVYVNAENITTLWLDGPLRTHLEVMNSNNKVNNTIEELGRLPKLKDLRIGWWVFEYITASGALRKLPGSLIHLKRVVIEKLDFADPAQAFSAVCLIRSAPYLQQLDFTADYTTAGNDGGQATIFPREDWALNHLQKAHISFVRCSRSELEFIKCVLAYSPSLKLTTVHFDPSVDDKVSSRISEELLKSNRASPKAQVIFNTSPK